MTLMSSKYSCQKNYFEAIFFRISDCAKNVMGYTVSKCHNRISEVEKSRRSQSHFCYNALPNLISQYTIRLVINYRTKSTQDYSFFNLENIITAVKY
jgi:hypothetical protein